MKLIALAIVCFVGRSSATSDAVCGHLREFRRCGTACPPTCDIPKPFCTQQCVSGCFCRRGTVLHNGRCIRPDRCPRRCNAPKVYKRCGSACPPTCNPNPRPCTLQCVAGCFCPDGTVLHKGRCIPRNACPKPCKPPKVYSSCGSACPATCDKTPRVCPAVCVPGCFCPPGKVMHRGRCIDRDECPGRCNAPKVYKQCGSACPPTCNPNPRPCTLQCVAGCFCPDGTVLHKGRCIPRNACPKPCKPPKVYSSCGSACPATCDKTPRVCPAVCVPGCFCPPGKVMHRGRCIDRDECPGRCKAPKVYKQCGSACPPTCNPIPRPCTEQCVAGCFCPDGTVLHKGRCLHRRQCPKVPQNPCRRNKCNKRGTRRCRPRSRNRYTCVCKPGWRGRFCKHRSCKNGRCSA